MKPVLEEIVAAVERVIESASRANEAKPQKYWFPLSVATYGVDEILEALDSMCAFRTTMWEKTVAFEREFARMQGRRHAVMVNSGSSADLLLAFLATNRAVRLLEPGDEILIPAVTWPTQIWSALMAGLRVRLVDVDPRTLNVDIDALEAVITPATRAIFVVHLLGNPCDMERITALAQRHDLVILEDCCEALGSTWCGRRVGNFGAGAVFSFFFSHHITTMEGGMVVVDDPRHADVLRVLRAHGWLRNAESIAPDVPDDIDPRYAFVNWGFNVRPTELQAGFGLHQLTKLEAFAERRRELADRFFTAIDSLPFLETPAVHPSASPSWMALPVLLAADAPFSRGDLSAYLESHGVETRSIVAGNIARQPALKLFPELAAGDLAGADIVHRRGLYVGLHPFVSDAAMDRLVGCFESFVRTYTSTFASA